MPRVGIDRFVRLKDAGVFFALNDQRAGQAFFSPRQGVVNQRVVARYVDLKLDDCCTTGRYHRGLHVSKRRARQRGLIINPIKNFADNVET